MHMYLSPQCCDRVHGIPRVLPDSTRPLGHSGGQHWFFKRKMFKKFVRAFEQYRIFNLYAVLEVERNIRVVQKYKYNVRNLKM